MMTKDEALKMAIEALKYHPSEDDALQACKEALARPAQEPDALEAIRKIMVKYGRDVADGIIEAILEQPAQEPMAWIKQGMDGYPKLVFNGKFEYESIAAKWDDIALYTKEQL